MTTNVVVRLESRGISLNNLTQRLPERTLNRLKCLTLCSILLNPQRAVILLHYKKGDPDIIQDIKVLLINRLAYEAVSIGQHDIFTSLDSLLSKFPKPALMPNYMLPKPHLWSIGQGFFAASLDRCLPKYGDNRLVLRAKQTALLLNFANYTWKVLGLEINPKKPNPIIDQEGFNDFFQYIRNIFEAHLKHMPTDLAELVKAHILDPATPFNLQLK